VKEAFNDGTRGLVSVSDVLWDESTKSHASRSRCPSLSGRRAARGSPEGRGRCARAARRGRRRQVEHVRKAFLIREDGSIVFSQRGSAARPVLRGRPVPRAHEELQGRRPAVPDRFQRARSVRPIVHGRHCAVQLGTSYPTWLDGGRDAAEDDLFAPSRAQMWRLLAVFGLIAAFVLASRSGSRCGSRAARWEGYAHHRTPGGAPNRTGRRLAPVSVRSAPRLSRRRGARHVRKSSAASPAVISARFPSSVIALRRRSPVYGPSRRRLVLILCPRPSPFSPIPYPDPYPPAPARAFSGADPRFS